LGHQINNKFKNSKTPSTATPILTPLHYQW